MTSIISNNYIYYIKLNIENEAIATDLNVLDDCRFSLLPLIENE